MTHTKEIWDVIDSKIEIKTSRGLLLCRVSQFTPKSIINREPERAELIAAAPKYLEALEKIIDAQYKKGGTLAELNNRISEAREIIKNAS